MPTSFPFHHARDPRPRTSRPRISRPRQGRLLVECAVGALLLSGGAVALAGATRSVAMLADDAALVARAQARAGAAAESAHVAGCGSPSTAVVDPRLSILATVGGSGGAETITLHARPVLSPLAGRTPAPLELVSARGCP